ncbi:MAG: MFS transporter [Candidatus Omnitrophota bacterium]
MVRVRFRDVLFSKNFFSLWSGQIISEFGDRLNQMALISLIYYKEPGSVMALARLLFFIIIPVFVIGPVAGVYVDRWDRKRTMIISDVLRGVLVLGIPVFVYLDMMVPVYVLVFLIFSATRFFLPSKMSFIPAIVSEEKLMVANALTNTTRMIATVLGFALAGLIVKLIGHTWGFYLNSISYFVSAAFIAVITPKRELKNVKEEIHMTKEIIEKSIRKNLWSEIIEGFGYVFRKSQMKIVTSTFFLLMSGAGAIFCIIIVFVQESFGSITEDLGLFGALLGVGLFLGTVVFGKIGQKFSKIRSIFVSFALCGIGINLFAFYARNNSSLLVGGFLILLIGVAVAPILTCTSTLIHVLIPDEARGRIFSSMEAIMHLGFMIFMFLTAYVSRFVSNFAILVTSGIVFLVVGVLGPFLASRSEASA